MWLHTSCGLSVSQVIRFLCCSNAAGKANSVRPPLTLGRPGQPDDQHVQFCWRCAEGGNLEKCTMCFRALHIECMRLGLPSEDEETWRCHYCLTREVLGLSERDV